MRALRSRGRWPKSVATISVVSHNSCRFRGIDRPKRQEPSSRSAAVKTESCPVYSALLTQHYREWFRKNTSIQIAAYTTPPDRSHGYMARSSAGADDETDRELIQQLLSQGDQKEKLEAKLKLPGQYVFVQGKPNIRKGVEPGIVTLSSVVFSKDGKRAMVWAGNLWQLVRKWNDVGDWTRPLKDGGLPTMCREAVGSFHEHESFPTVVNQALALKTPVN